jgi:hypothetical protein
MINIEAETAAACPCCGSFVGATLGMNASPLLAVADVLVIRALEAAGKRLVRSSRVGRSRFEKMRDRPLHTAHTLWRPDPELINKALVHAWDVVPAMLSAHGCCNVTAGQVTEMLDSYTRDLLITGTPHRLSELRYRFGSRLGIQLPPEEHAAHA